MGIDEELILGLYMKNPDDQHANPDYRRIRLDKPQNLIQLQLSELPEYIVLDPMVTRLDKEISDNQIQVKNSVL